MYKVTLEAFGPKHEDIEMALSIAQENALFIVEKGIPKVQVEKFFMRGSIQGATFMLEVEKVDE